MRIFAWAFAAFLLIVLQTGLLVPLGLWPVNLILVFVVLALLAGRLQGSMTAAIAGGLMLDFLSGSADGIFTFTFLLTWWFMHAVYEGFVKREVNRWTFVLSVLGGTWVFGICLLLVNWVYSWFNQGQVISWSNYLLTYFVWGALFNLLLSYPIWKYISFVEIAAEKLNKKK